VKTFSISIAPERKEKGLIIDTDWIGLGRNENDQVSGLSKRGGLSFYEICRTKREDNSKALLCTCFRQPEFKMFASIQMKMSTCIIKTIYDSRKVTGKHSSNVAFMNIN
jgi:hypothetical protein